jgi:hypothetical protein
MAQVYKIPQNGGGTLHSLGVIQFIIPVADGSKLSHDRDHQLRFDRGSKYENIDISDFRR